MASRKWRCSFVCWRSSVPPILSCSLPWRLDRYAAAFIRVVACIHPHRAVARRSLAVASLLTYALWAGGNLPSPLGLQLSCFHC